MRISYDAVFAALTSDVPDTRDGTNLAYRSLARLAARIVARRRKGWRSLDEAESCGEDIVEWYEAHFAAQMNPPAFCMF
jgi:hypothetical protein